MDIPKDVEAIFRGPPDFWLILQGARHTCSRKRQLGGCMHKEGYGRLDLVFSDSPAGRCPECEGAGTGIYLWGDEEKRGERAHV